MNVNTMYELAEHLSELSYSTELDLIIRRRTHDDAKLELDRSVAEITQEVASELNEDGKAAFSNETARKAEVTKRREERHRETLKVLRKHAHNHEVLILDLKRLRDRLRNAQAYLGGLTNGPPS